MPKHGTKIEWDEMMLGKLKYKYGIGFNADGAKAIIEGRKTQTRRPIKPQPGGFYEIEVVKSLECPYGKVGDVLYVREPFTMITNPMNEDEEKLLYIADYPALAASDYGADEMSLSQSRMEIRITNTRVERLQDISEKDAEAEGVPETILMEYPNGEVDSKYFYDPRAGTGYGSAYTAFAAEIWGKLPYEKEYSWNSDPLVWVIEFEVIPRD